MVLLVYCVDVKVYYVWGFIVDFIFDVDMYLVVVIDFVENGVVKCVYGCFVYMGFCDVVWEWII